MLDNITLYEIYNKETPFESLAQGTGIVLVGTASTGPAMTPVRIADIADAAIIFGVNSQLTYACNEALIAGASDVYLIRINGTHAVAEIQGSLKLTATEAVHSVNDLRCGIVSSENGRFLVFIDPISGYNILYSLANKTVRQIASEININALKFESPIYATVLKDGDTSSVFQDIPTGQILFSGGNPQDTMNDFSEGLASIFDYLESYPVGHIGILCESFYKSYPEKGYLYQMASDFTKNKMNCGEPCMVTIGLQSIDVDRGLVRSAAENFSNIIQSECRVSEFINIVLAELTYEDFRENYRSFGVAAYCGLTDGLETAEGSTNKRIFGATSDTLYIDHSSGDVDIAKSELAGRGYVLFKNGVYGGEKQVRVLRGTNFVRYFNKAINLEYIPDLPSSLKYERIIPKLMSDVGNVRLVQYISFTFSEEMNRKDNLEIPDIRASIGKIMDSLKDYIKDYRLTVTKSNIGFAGTYVANLEIVPVGEVESIPLSIYAK